MAIHSVLRGNQREYEVHVAPYEKDHLARIIALFSTHFPESDRLLSPAYSEWLYQRNPFGRSLSIWVTPRGSEDWTAFLAFIPIRFSRRSEALGGYYAVNALVHPQHQGHQLFGRMISAGRDFIRDERVAFVGHPNAQAMRTWTKMDVHFQEELHPALASLGLLSRAWRAWQVREASELEKLREMFLEQAEQRNHWKVAATPEYLHWRFFQHPSSNYQVQLLTHRGVPAGIQVTRRMRPGVNLLMDQFVVDEHLPAVTRMLPPITVCVLAESSLRARPPVWRLPLRKTIPYFFSADPALEMGASRHLNLTPSDF
jgi:hypothetical protein